MEWSGDEIICMYEIEYEEWVMFLREIDYVSMKKSFKIGLDWVELGWIGLDWIGLNKIKLN